MENNKKEKVHPPIEFKWLTTKARNVTNSSDLKLDLSSIGYEFAPAPPREVTVTKATPKEMRKRKGQEPQTATTKKKVKGVHAPAPPAEHEEDNPVAEAEPPPKRRRLRVKGPGPSPPAGLSPPAGPSTPAGLLRRRPAGSRDTGCSKCRHARKGCAKCGWKGR